MLSNVEHLVNILPI